MHERKDIENELAEYIRRELIGGRRDDEDFQLNADDDLLTSGLVDSLGVMRLVQFIEQRFELSVPPADLTIENFIDIATTTTYIQSRQTGDAAVHG